MKFINKSILVLCSCFALSGAHPLVDFKSSNDVEAAATGQMWNGQSGTCIPFNWPLLHSCLFDQNVADRRFCDLIDVKGDLTIGYCCPTPTDNKPVTCGSQTTSTPRPVTEVKINPANATTMRPPTGLVCGIGPKDTIPTFEESKIVGGKPAVPNSWPFMVRLNVDGFSCGGSLLDAYHILTAAHCIYEKNFNKFVVELGGHTNSWSSIEDGAVRRSVIKATLHEKYNSRTNINDIAILRMNKPVTFNEKISPVCLTASVNSDNDYAGNDSVAIGWGNAFIGGLSSDVLQQVTLKVISNLECINAVQRPGRVVDEMFCAIAPGKDACQGDSGGPLVVKEPASGSWVQVGITSFAFTGCALPDEPGIYTRVTSFVKWITENSRL